MSNRINITCKESSFLISKKQETNLNTKEKVQLFFHLKICSVCRLFKTQTNLLVHLLKHNKKEYLTNESLNNEAKIKIENLLKNEIEKSSK